MSEKAPGFEVYTPSRLEWLTVLLNSSLPYLDFSDGSVMYLPGNDGKTIILRCSHSADADPEKINYVVEKAKDFAIGMAETHNWGSWIKVQTSFKEE